MSNDREDVALATPPAPPGPARRSWRRPRGPRAWYAAQPLPVRIVVLLVMLAAAALLPDLGYVPLVGPQLITVGVDWPSALFNMSYYVLLALGLNVVVGFSGLLDLGYVGFFAIGAYTVALLTSRAPTNVLHTDWPWLAAVPVAVALAMLSGLILGWPTLRLRGDYLAIVTLGFAEIIYTVAGIANGPLRGDNGIPQVASPPGHHADGTPIFGVSDARPFFWLGLGVVALAMLSGLILGWPTLRLRGDYLAIVTLGFAEIIYTVAGIANGPLRGDNGIPQVASPPGHHADGTPIFGVSDATPFFWLGLGVVVLAIVGVRNLDRSRVGRSWLAIREDEEAAELMGVRTIKYKLWAFAIGASTAGLGGVLFAGEQSFINNQTFILQFSILVLAGVVMGGSGSIPGAVLGGALISYIPDRLAGQQILGQDASQYRFLMFGVIIILIMIFRPQGLIPSRRRAMELKDRQQEVAP